MDIQEELKRKGLLRLKTAKRFKLNAKKSKAKYTRSRIEERIRAKALFLSSNGKMPIRDIAREVGVSSVSVSKWRREGDWDRELRSLESEVQRKLNEHLVHSKEIHGLLTDVSDAKLAKVVESFVGRSVERQVAQFLTKVYAQDLKDLSDLNKAIQLKLVQGKVEFLSPFDINVLVTAKTNIIKAVRMIFGQSTENVSQSTQTNELHIHLLKGSKQEESLRTVGALRTSPPRSIAYYGDDNGGNGGNGSGGEV